MAREPKALELTQAEPTQAKPTQAEPTQPRPVSPEGYTLDGWGLPLSGPARARALAGQPDPALDAAPTPHPAPDAPTPQD